MDVGSDRIFNVVTENVEIARSKPGQAPLLAYLAHPTGEERRPAVIIIHEIFGLNDNIREIARRFAAEGYAALAVDLFSGGDNRRLCIIRVMSALALRPLKSRAIGDLRRAIDWIQLRPEVDAGRIGAIGFCFGGGYALALACIEPDLGASSVFYGTNIRLLRSVARACPIVGSYPGNDFTARSGRRLDIALGRYDIPHDIKIYPGTRHAFFNNTLESYDPDSAADSWQRTLTFFAEYLGQAGVA